MKVLFICIENTCRSQMAEGFARAIGLDAESAGVNAGNGVNKNAVKVMAEIGINISKYKSKAMNYDLLNQYDAIISMCSIKTTDFCPSAFIGAQANWNIEDPKDKPLAMFRQIRDEIQAKVEELAGTIKSK